MSVARNRLTIDRIDHVLLLVRGLSDALTFYEGILGCEVENRFPKFGMVELRAGASHLDLVDVEERVEERSVSFYVKDPSGNTIELVAAR